METEQKIRKVLEEVAGKPIEIDKEQSLFKSGFLDSFVLVDLVGALEQEFRIKIPDSDLIPWRFDSVARIERYLAGCAQD